MNSIDTITKVKRYWEADIPLADIAKIIGVSDQTVKEVCGHLNKVYLRSPLLKEKAIVAAQEILESKDNSNRVKLISLIFNENKGLGINLNINNVTTIDPRELDFKNEKYDYIDMENH